MFSFKTKINLWCYSKSYLLFAVVFVMHSFATVVFRLTALPFLIVLYVLFVLFSAMFELLSNLPAEVKLYFEWLSRPLRGSFNVVFDKKFVAWRLENIKSNQKKKGE